MRILHLNHTPLPDSRVEKSAMSIKKKGHVTYFLGPKGATSSPAFDYVIGTRSKWNFYAGLGILSIIKKINPDVIHAYDIYAARLVLDKQWPMVYDDREYWPMQIQMARSRSLRKRLVRKYRDWRVPKWQEKLFEVPCIVNNKNTAYLYRKEGARAFVVRNYPALYQVERLPHNNSRKGAVYIGRDFQLEKFSPHRDMTGLTDHIEFDVLTGLPHREMMERLTNYKVGLTPWKYHNYLWYSDQNKNYEYLHAGLQVIMSSQLAYKFGCDPYIHRFSNYAQLQTIIEGLPDYTPKEIMDHAKENYLWEQQEHNIWYAYRFALEGD